MSRLRRKWSFKISGKKYVLIKHAHETEEHVYMKAFMVALYIDSYPEIQVETPYHSENKYKPDLLSLSMPHLSPHFWGECGKVSEEKLKYLLQYYPSTQLAFAKWGSIPHNYRDIISGNYARATRKAGVDLMEFNNQHLGHVSDNGEIELGWPDLRHWRINGNGEVIKNGYTLS